MSKKSDDLPGEEEVGEISIDEPVAKDNASSSNGAEGDSNNVEEDFGKLKSEYLYLRAEFDNFRKQSIKERSDLIKYGAERFVRQILSVLDNFELALGMDINEKNYQEFEQGMQMTANELNNTLGELGVKKIDPKGESFDPNLHEALSSQETNELPEGHVVNVLRKGYQIHERVIRPAQVVVATPLKPKEDPPPVPEDSNSGDEG